MSKKPRIDQWLPSLGKYDAIGNEVRMIQQHLRDRDIESEVYVERDPGQSKARPIQQFSHEGQGHLILYHFSTGSDLVYRLLNPNWMVATRFHNITPPSYFHKIAEPGPYDACLKGYMQLPLVAAVSNVAIHTSTYTQGCFPNSQPNWVTPVIRSYDRFKAASKERAKRKHKQILFVGRMTRHKGIHDLIFTVHALKEYFGQQVQLVLAGLRDLHYATYDLPRICERLGLSHEWEMSPQAFFSGSNSSICHLGSLAENELARLYQESDLFLCMSRHEGFCVPLVEALHASLPVVALEKAAIPETLQGSPGVLNDRLSWHARTTFIHKVLNESKTRQTLLDSQLELSLRYSPEAIKLSLKDMIDRLLSEAGKIAVQKSTDQTI